MEKERERIERMLREGKITKEESEELLKALEESTAALKKKAIKKSRMKIIGISTVMVGLIIIGGLFVVSQLSKERIRLEYKVKKGDILQYKQIQTQGKIEFKTAYRKPKIVDIKRETYFTIKIKDVDNKGMAQASMTIKAVIEDEKNGEKTSEFFDFSNRPILMKISKQGKTEVENWEECKAIFKELKMSSIAVQFSPILPAKKVKVGDTWTYEEERNSLLFDLPPIDVKLENKVMGFEKISGDDCVKILTTQKTVIPIQKGKASIPGLTGQAKVTIKDFDLNKKFVTYFAYDKGRPVRMEGAITGGEKRIYQRIKEGKEQSWKTDVKYEFAFVLIEVTPEKLYQEGTKLWREGKIDEAIKILREVVDKYPKTNRAGCALMYLGQIYIGQNNYQKAIEIFREAVEKHPSSRYGDGVIVGAYSRLYLGRCYIHEEKWDKAKKILNQLLEKYPESIDHRGRKLAPYVRSLLEEIETKETKLQRKIDREISQLGTGDRFKALNVLIKIGKPAVPALIKALQDQSNPFTRRWEAAKALGAIKDERAVEPLIKAMSDENEVVRRVTAEALGRLGDKRAIPALKKALRDPKYYFDKRTGRKRYYTRESAAEALEKLGIEVKQK